MVLTASTQWSIPLLGCISAVPSVSKPSSLLGLKTCQLLQHPSELGLSSRRQSVDQRSRSAGSFQALQASGKLEGFSLHNQEVEAEKALSLHSPTSRAKVIHIDGDITAADVDLLPMPSLVSYPSGFRDSYFSPSPTDSVMTRISSSDSISSENSCKSGGMASNLLGLPPSFRQEMDSRDDKNLKCDEFVRTILSGSPRTPSGCHGENDTFRQQGSRSLGEAASDFHDFISRCVSNPAEVEEDDNFADSLAVFWSQHPMNGDTEMLHDSGSLASILTDVPQKFCEESPVASANPKSNAENCIATDFIMDELDFLVIPTKELSEKSSLELPCVFQPIVSARKEPLTSSGSRESFQDETFSDSTRYDVSNLNEVIESWSSQHLEAVQKMQATSSETSFNGSSVEFQTREISSLPTLSNQVLENRINSAVVEVGRKRPFSLLELASNTSAPTVPSCTTVIQPNSWLAQPESVELLQHRSNMSYASATQAFSAMLYKSQGAQSLHLTAEDNEPKPPPSKVRRRHGTAMDPQSIAARTRREKFSDRIRILQGLVPNAERLDTVSMLGQTLEYVRFLQHQVWQLYHGLDPASPNSLKSEKWKDFLEPKRPSS